MYNDIMFDPPEYVQILLRTLALVSSRMLMAIVTYEKAVGYLATAIWRRVSVICDL